MSFGSSHGAARSRALSRLNADLAGLSAAGNGATAKRLFPFFPVVSTKKFRPPQFVHNLASIFHCGDLLLEAQYRHCKREMS
jgi:hypothetical protein